VAPNQKVEPEDRVTMSILQSECQFTFGARTCIIRCLLAVPPTLQLNERSDLLRCNIVLAADGDTTLHRNVHSVCHSTSRNIAQDLNPPQHGCENAVSRVQPL